MLENHKCKGMAQDACSWLGNVIITESTNPNPNGRWAYTHVVCNHDIFHACLSNSSLIRIGHVEPLSDVVVLAQRAGPVLLDRFAGYCARWLAGADARFGRAAAQTMGVLAEAEGSKFGRRAALLLPQLLATLRAHSTAGQVSAQNTFLPDLAFLQVYTWLGCV